MNISAIRGYQATNFTANTAVKSPAKAKKEIDTKKVVITAVGLTAAGLAAWAIINKVRKGKGAEAAQDAKETAKEVAKQAKTFVPGNWKPEKNIGPEMEQFNKKISHEINLQRTADINREIAEVEARTSKAVHDVKQLDYERIFAKENTPVVKRADLDVARAKYYAERHEARLAKYLEAKNEAAAQLQEGRSELIDTLKAVADKKAGK